ncbi:MAG: endonuclease III [Spirochaetales bacterium]|nr:endonuclease III [Spirochaetales bacterium]
MTSENRQRTFLVLEEHYDSQTSLLHYETAFQLLVAVALSAQTTDNQVNKITPSLFSRFPDPESLGKANLEEVEEIIHSTGFYRTKAKNILRAGMMIYKDFGGIVPDSMDDLITIPGIGRKSAGVILHHIYHKPAIIVDTHFGRVMYRLGLTQSKDPGVIEKDIAALFPSDQWSGLSMTANLHGRALCHGRKPKCAECFLAPLCPRQGVVT